jgi:purine-binding chemotaxis protein CheW
VITLADAQIKPAPDLGGHADTSHIIGFGTLDDRMRILMDVERLMDGADLGAMNSKH